MLAVCGDCRVRCASLFLNDSMQSIQNLGLAIISIIAGMILDTRGYLFLEVFFIACVSREYAVW